MINHNEARTGLAKLIATLVPDTISVYRSAFDGVPGFPCVVIGMPTWEPDARTNYCATRSTWPVAIVVGRPGTDDAGTVTDLDQLWQLVADGLLDASARDPELGGIGVQSVITRAAFGLFNIRGVDYPAQTIFVDIYG